MSSLVLYHVILGMYVRLWKKCSCDILLLEIYVMGVYLLVHNRLVTENQLDEWVRGNSRQAQGIIVELVWRLVAASSPRPHERRFPLGDSIG